MRFGVLIGLDPTHFGEKLGEIADRFGSARHCHWSYIRRDGRIDVSAQAMLNMSGVARKRLPSSREETSAERTAAEPRAMANLTRWSRLATGEKPVLLTERLNLVHQQPAHDRRGSKQEGHAKDTGAQRSKDNELKVAQDCNG